MILISDIHLKKNIFAYQSLFLKKMTDEANDNEDLFILGDVMDDRKKITHFLIDSFSELMEYFSLKFRHIYIVSGNHDKDEDDSLNSLLNVYKYMSNVTVFTDFCFLPDENYLFAPFFKDNLWYEKLNMILDKSSIDKHTIMFGHKTISGFKRENGTETEGLTVMKKLRKLNRVFLGDLHKRQEVNNIVSVGSFLQDSFGQSIDKGFTIYRNGKLSFLNNKIILFSDLRYNLDLKFDFDNVYEDIQKIKSPFLRITFHGSKNKILKIPSSEMKSKFEGKFKKFKIVIKLTDDKELRKDIIRENTMFFDNDFFDYCNNEGMSKKQKIYGKKLFNL